MIGDVPSELQHTRCYSPEVGSQGHDLVLFAGSLFQRVVELGSAHCAAIKHDRARGPADNFCKGKGRHSQDVYLVDLGFAKVYDSEAAVKVR